MNRILYLTSFLLVGFIYLLKDEPQETKLTPVREYPRTELPKNLTTQNEADKNIRDEVSSAMAAPADDTIPWEMLREQRDEAIRGFLTEVDRDRSEKIFEAYQEARLVSVSEVNRLMALKEQLVSIDPETGKNTYHHRIKYEELEKQIEQTMNDYSDRLQSVFGEHYAGVSQVNAEFNKGIQSYNNDRFNIGLGL